MSTIFRLDSSIRGEGSVTRAVADTAVAALSEELGAGTVVTHREVGLTPLSSELWATAAFAGFTPEEARTEAQKAAVAEAAELATELIDADVAVIAVPFYNWGVSQHVKTWIDVLLTDSRLASSNPESVLKGKPAFLVIARGGGYSEGTPRYGWDHATAWLERILADVWGMDVKTIAAELTLAESTPAMAGLVELSKEQLAKAHADAAEHGKAVAAAIAA